MTQVHLEEKFEDAIEASMLAAGWHRGSTQGYRPAWGLDVEQLFAFLTDTQPRAWKKILGYYGGDEAVGRTKFAERLAAELDQRGPLDVLRHGMKDHGVKVSLAFFAPASTLSDELVSLHAANRLSVTRQLRYSATTTGELDLALFVNGIPTATAELKNPLTGQDVEHAKAQYRQDRSPKELLFARRALVHFAVDPDLVFLTTRLTGPSTRFLPFNLGTGGAGNEGGAGNPTSDGGYKTAYLWEQVWSPDNWLDLLRRFLHVEDPVAPGKGKPVGKKPWHARTLIFPRLHQWHAVRSLTDHAAEHGAGQNYLVQHSAGSGKSNTIAWLAHRLSSLHNAENSKVFHKVIVITDRVVLDRQLQDTIFQFDHTVGVVEKVDKTSAQLAKALTGETAQVIITTLQKFPFVLESAGTLAGSRFAVIVDEAHSSQTGETAKALKQVLAQGVDATVSSDGDAILVAAEVAEAIAEAAEDASDPLVSSALARGRHENLSFFAFTATPKAKTLELFGALGDDHKHRPFHVYSMKQAIEEGFILDVLRNYVTYATYYKLTRIGSNGASSDASDREVDKRKAAAELARFASLHPSNMTQRAEIIVEHFRAHTAHRLGGRAKAMVVTRSRLHAVRTRAAIADYIKTKGYQGLHTLVAFSGVVEDDGVAYTEAMVNGFGESSLPEHFTYTSADDPLAGREGAGQVLEYHVLVVAEKYQTGFDQPLLTTMYVDKKLEGVKAVQTLSRLNRTHPLKSQDDVFVLDFANEAVDIAESFAPFYETTITEPTDPNLLYASQTEVMGFGLLVESEMDSYVGPLLASGGDSAAHAKLYHFTDPALDRYVHLLEEDRETAEEFRSTLRNYTRAYAFLAQVIPFHDADLERLHLYGKALLQRLPRSHDATVDLGAVDLSHLRIVKTGDTDVSLGAGLGEQILPGFTGGGRGSQTVTELALIDQVIAAINDRLGGNLTDADKVWVQQTFEYAAEDPHIRQTARANTEENFGYVFDKQFEGLVLDRHDANAGLIDRVFKDSDTTTFFTSMARKIVYELARGAGEAS
ncbi:DEAD/DEAH box helicase family protein [Cellulomonas cellasea]|uniref:type I restriction endonuclease subunit R n=1 Tax=Cellulomonas cellasea TaxID=43670 RepID=UPI0025A368AE|nr:DEAD/DEAH box helicase family protein [Cellulomonas cellasea]MDM8084886.1 DEAD/DEAH box helicase family protein [Cellulomonas cellasea]